MARRGPGTAVAAILLALAAVPYFAASAAAADISVSIRPDDPLHRELRLAGALGLLAEPLRGHAPISRAEAFRLFAPLAAGVTRESGMVPVPLDPARGVTRSVSARLTAARDGLVPWDLFWEDRVYPTDFGLRLLERVALTAADVEGGLAAPADGDHGEALTEGAALVRDGSFFLEGEGLAIASAWRLRIDRRAATYRPLVLTARTGWRNLRVGVGREPLAWGPGPRGGFLLTANARPLDMLRIESEAPFRLPGPLRGAGSWTAATFLGRVRDDARADAPDPWLNGMRLTCSPSRWLVLGASRTTMLGGEGRRFALTPRTALDLLFARNADGEDGGNTVDHKLSVDASVALWPIARPLPLLDGGRVYGEYAGEGSPRGGAFSVPARRLGVELVGHGVLVRVELADVTHGGAVWYRDDAYPDGYTARGRELGHPMGPAARSTGCELEAPLGVWGLATARWERRRRERLGEAGDRSATRDFVAVGIETRARGGTIRLEAGSVRGSGALELWEPREEWSAGIVWRP